MGSSWPSYWLISGNLIMQDFHRLKFDEMFYFMHLFFLFKSLRPLRLWPFFHSGFIIKQKFLPPLFPRR